MDFEKEARELLDAIWETPERYEVSVVATALHRAFSAGEEAMREKAGKIVDAKSEWVLARQGPERSDMDSTINMNIRLTTVLLPEIAAAIRSTPLSKAPG